MNVTVITPPQPIISWSEASTHLRLDDGDDQQSYVEGLVAVATGWLDGPTGWLGRALGEQTLEARFDCWPSPLRLPCPPLLAIEAASYVDPQGTDQQVTVTNGLLDLGPTPRVRGQEGDVRIRYRAGYAKTQDDAVTVPAPIRHAILLMVSHLFNNRDAVTVTAAQPAELPMGVDRLLAGFRVPRVG
jgi:uncharacterized phiE125 gp8 family phage protein